MLVDRARIYQAFGFTPEQADEFERDPDAYMAARTEAAAETLAFVDHMRNAARAAAEKLNAEIAADPDHPLAGLTVEYVEDEPDG